MNEILQLIIFPLVVGVSIVAASTIASWIKNWWNSPKLRIETDDFYPYPTIGIKRDESYADTLDERIPIAKKVVSEHPIECIYYHLVLKNNGRAMAKNVVVKIEIYDENGKELDKISQLKLEQREFDDVNIASNSSEIYDFCFIEKTPEPELFFSSIVGLKSIKRQNYEPFKLGTYLVNAYIYADNFKQKKPYSLRVTRNEGFSEESVKIELI